MNSVAVPATPDPILSVRDEWRRGGRVVVSAHIGMATGAGLYLYTSSLFVLPFSISFGWSRGDISTGTAMALLGTISAPLIGRCADRFGTRRVAMTFACCLAACFAGLSQMTGPYIQFLLLSAMFGALAPGSSGLVFSRAVSSWFRKARGQALGIMSAGGSIGALLFTPLASWMIARYGIEGGYLTLAGLTLFIGLPAIAWGLRDLEHVTAKPGELRSSGVVNDQPGDVPSLPLGRAIRSRSFAAIAVAVFVLNAPGAGVLTQLDPLLLKNGVEARSLLIALFAAAVLIGRVGIGWLFDRFDARHVATLFTLTGALGCLMLMSGMPLAAVTVAVVFVGLLQGMETDVIAYFVARHFHRDQFGVMFGLLFAISLLGTALGIVGFGKLYDATLSYDLPLILAGGILMIAILAYLCIPARSR